MPEAGYLVDILVVLAAAVVCVPLLQRLRVSPVLGYLVAGVVIGPHALGIIRETEATHILAEFGVLFLLFAIGLDLPLRRLIAMRRYIFGLGLAQVVATALVIALVIYAAGFDAQVALVMGGALALSSTATVLQLLVERREVADRHGRVSVAVLLFQDLAVVPMLALLPILAQGGTDMGAALALAGLKAAAAIAVILLVGRLLLRPAYRLVAEARTPEIFVATTLLLVLFTGWATAQVGMSMALGAFLAGLLLADSEYRHQVEADIQPFRGLFLGLFFITVGMGVDLGRIAADAGLVFGAAAALLAGKAALLFVLCRAFRLNTLLSTRVALLLSQGGEFAFVIGGLAMQLGVIEADIGQTAMVVVALSMATTPLAAALGHRLAARRTAGAPEALETTEGMRELSGHVIVAGFGRVGWTVCKLLERHQIPYVALDVDMDRVRRGRDDNMPVYFGDASRLDVLRAAGLEHARAAVVTLDQPGLAERAVAAVRSHAPGFTIVSRARDGAHRKRLEEAGASAVVSEAVEASLQLGAKVLRLTGQPDDTVESSLDEFRREDYALLDHLLAESKAAPSAQDPMTGPSMFARYTRRGRRSDRTRAG